MARREGVSTGRSMEMYVHVCVCTYMHEQDGKIDRREGM